MVGWSGAKVTLLTVRPLLCGLCEGYAPLVRIQPSAKPMYKLLRLIKE